MVDGLDVVTYVVSGEQQTLYPGDSSMGPKSIEI